MLGQEFASRDEVIDLVAGLGVEVIQVNPQLLVPHEVFQLLVEQALQLYRRVAARPEGVDAVGVVVTNVALLVEQL